MHVWCVVMSFLIPRTFTIFTAHRFSFDTLQCSSRIGSFSLLSLPFPCLSLFISFSFLLFPGLDKFQSFYLTLLPVLLDRDPREILGPLSHVAKLRRRLDDVAGKGFLG